MPDHLGAPSIMDSLAQQKKTGHLCDVLFYNESGTIWAHSCILASFSPFFSRLFSMNLEQNNHWSLKQPLQISVGCMTKRKSKCTTNCIKCLAQVINFVYSGEIKPDLFHLQHMLILCNRLENEELSKICEKYRQEHALLKKFSKNEYMNAKKLEAEVGCDTKNEKTCLLDEEELQNNSDALGFNNKHEDSENMLSENGSTDQNICSKCYYSSNDSSMMETHSKVFHHKGYKCLSCDFSSNKISLLIDHIASQCGSEENVICSICLFQSNSASELSQHVKEHSNPRPFKCFKCKRLFDKRSLWLKHVLVHIQKEKIQCPSCDLSFNTKAESIKHHKVVHDPKKYVCQDCGFAVPFAYLLKKHMQKHRKSVINCKEEGCDFKTSSEIMLIRHRSIHKSRTTVKREDKKECSVCKIKFTLSKNLARHMKMHKLDHKKFKCYFCSYETFREDKLNEHITYKHPNFPDRNDIELRNVRKDSSAKNVSDEPLNYCVKNPKEKLDSHPQEGKLKNLRNECHSIQSLRDNVESSFSQKHNTLMMNHEGDISIVNTNETNPVPLTLRNLGNLTGSITMDEKTGIITMNNINSGSVFLNEITGELTYINLENDKNREMNYFNNEPMKEVDNFQPSIRKQDFSSEVTKLDEFTGEIIKVVSSNEENVSAELEFDSFDMDINDESFDGFDDFDEPLFDIFENDVDLKVVLPLDLSEGKSPCVMPRLDESTGLLTFDEDQPLKCQDMWIGKFNQHTENGSQMNNDEVYQLLLDEVTGVLHD